MLNSLGWDGRGGLGIEQQGLQEPIRPADLRGKNEKFIGVGAVPLSKSEDPFERYRQSKSDARSLSLTAKVNH